MEYGGTRLKLNADLAGARIHLQVDIGFGDVITPSADSAEYPVLLDHPAPSLRVYTTDLAKLLIHIIPQMTKHGRAMSWPLLSEPFAMRDWIPDR